MKISNFVLLVALVSCSGAYAGDGGGIVGSGQPGLILSPKDSGSGDEVIVSPPADSHGILLVSGEVGLGQKETLRLHQCPKDNVDRFVGACWINLDVKINQPTPLAVGDYWLTFDDKSISAGAMKISIKPGETKNIRLKKIKIPKGRFFFTARVFKDYGSDSSKKELIQYLLETNFFIEINCNKEVSASTDDRDPGVVLKNSRAACEAYNSAIKNKNLDDLVGSFARFNKDSSVSVLERNVSGYYGASAWYRTSDFYRDYVGSEFSDINFISVLPGTYGIEFQGEGNARFSEYGIVVQ